MGNKFAKLDAYPKTLDEVQVRTYTGAIVSIIAMLIMLCLILVELSYVMETRIVEHLAVDTTRGSSLPIEFDITLHRAPCPLVALDALDVLGHQQVDLDHQIHKQPLNRDGREKGSKERVQDLKDKEAVSKEAGPSNPLDDPDYCGSCYGADTEVDQCCNDCESVKRAYNDKGWSIGALENIEQCFWAGETRAEYVRMLTDQEGCRITGKLNVAKLEGSFSFHPSTTFAAAHDLDSNAKAFDLGLFDTSHTINGLTFGKAYSGQVNALAGVSKSNTEFVADEEVGMSVLDYYYLKVVATTFPGRSADDHYQYAFTSNSKQAIKEGTDVPSIYFKYGFSSVVVEYSEESSGLLHFVTQVCAIIGGVFTVAGMVDRFIYVTVAKFGGKTELGMF